MPRPYHIRNFSIFLRQLPDGDDYLFGYYEYDGDDYEADRKLSQNLCATLVLLASVPEPQPILS